MIIFLADGRLGNQLFQYAFLQSLRKEGELLITSGLEEIDQYFEHAPYLNISRNLRLTRIFMYEIIKRLLSLLSSLHLITTISVVTETVKGIERETLDTHTQNGMLNNLKYVKTAFFQSELFFNKEAISDLKLKDKYLAPAAQFLKRLPKGAYPVCIHVRRGDYQHFTISGINACLPIAYFKKNLSWFVRHKKKTYFIFISDEPELVARDFNNVKPKLISYSHDPGIDLSILTLSRSAILSPSSFSWWGAYFMKQRDVVIAPKYWLGFQVGIECQEKGTPSYALQKPV